VKDLLSELAFGPNLEVSARSLASPHGGSQRENQDNYLVVDGHGRAVFLKNEKACDAQIKDWPPGHVRLAIMDGVSGMGQGREAAECVVDGLLATPACCELAQLDTVLDALHHQIRERFAHLTKTPGCTLVLLEWPANSEPMLAHVGDSRLYEVNAERTQVLTVDHCPATAYAMRNTLNEEEWWQQVHGEDRSMLAQALGIGNTLSSPLTPVEPELRNLRADDLPEFLRAWPDRRVLKLEPDCIYLLATDGLWSFADPQSFVQRWSEILLPPTGQALDHALDSLFCEHVLASREEQSVDNTTVIAFRLKP